MAAVKNRTEQEIIDTLLRLSRSQPLASISVTKVCREAEISRQTFYTHFKDKYDVAQRYLAQLLEDNFTRLGLDLGWHEAYLNEFRNIEKVIHQHPDILANLFADPSDYNSVINSASRSAAEDFRACFRRRYGSMPDRLIAFQIDAFAREASLVSSDWIRSNCAIPAETFTDMFVTLIPQELFNALNVEDAVNR